MKTIEQMPATPEIKTCEKHGQYEVKYMKTMYDKVWVLDHCTTCVTENDAKQKLQEENDLVARSIENKIKHRELIRVNAGISKRNLYKTFDDYICTNEGQTKAKNDCMRYFEGFPSDKSMIMVGGVGTGKTLLALAAALEKRKHYRQIFMARPIIALSNKDIGYLPGDIESKLFPYMQPLYDNLSVIQNQYSETEQKYKQIKKYLEEEKLVIAPLAYIRGRSLVKIYFIVDEAQNLTPHEVKTIITRAGESTKIVFTGDIFQIDHPYLDTQSNGLSYLIEKMKGQNLYAHINLEKGERSELADLASSLL